MMTISIFFYKLAMGESVFNLNMVSASFWILGFFIFLPSLVILLELPILIDQNNPTTSYIYGDFNNNHLHMRYLNFLQSYNLQTNIRNIVK